MGEPSLWLQYLQAKARLLAQEGVLRGARFRSQHASHAGPICPVCHTPLETHRGRIPPAYAMKTISPRLRIVPGIGGKPCFEVLYG